MQKLSFTGISLALLSAFAPDLTCQSPFRSIDGTDNNLINRDWGSAGVVLLRELRVAYGDGVSTPAGAARPSARAISNAVCAQRTSRTNEARASCMLWQWGQFIDHDITAVEAQTPRESFPIAVPRGDAWFDPASTGTVTIGLSRSHYRMVSDASSLLVRQQVNDITAFLDASMIYGSDSLRAATLRGAGGLLATSAGGLLPFNVTGLPNAPTARDPSYFLAGDIRANEQVGLTALHTLFVREHNLIASILRGAGFDDEVSYQITRAIVGAEIQAITFREFLPVLLGPDAIPPYSGYRTDIDPGIANAFAGAAYRLGHSMLPTELWRLDREGRPIARGHLRLQDAFFAPKEVLTDGIEPYLRGLCVQSAEEIDTQIVDGVRNFLFGEPGSGGFDLASLNIQRGRDHGLPSYNQARRDVGLPPARRFEDVTRDRETQQRLASVYASVDDIDLWVGGLAEDHVRDGMVGELLFRMLRTQFVRLQTGDRFWYQIALPTVLVDFVDNRRLSDIIRDNTEISSSEITRDAFRVPGRRR